MVRRLLRQHEAGINVYLNAMDGLEQHYPDVEFVYMTGHLDGTGPSAILYARNNQIRAWCLRARQDALRLRRHRELRPGRRVLPERFGRLRLVRHVVRLARLPSCGECAHSHCFNCYRKGKAFWWLMAASLDGTSTAVAEPTPGVPERPCLVRCAPNPFEGAGTVTFSLPASASVTLEVFNLRGERIATLVDGVLVPGEHTATWDGSDAAGRRVGSGVYFYRLRAGGETDAKKAVFLR